MKLNGFVKSVLVFLGGIVLGWVLLIAVYSIPVSKIEGNVAKSLEIVEKEGNYPASFDGFMSRFSLSEGLSAKALLLNNRGFSLDEYTTEIMLKQAAAKSEYTPFLASLDNDGYSRYWHGYLVALKVLLVFFDYSVIRIINAVVMSALVIVLCVLMHKKIGKESVIAFIFALFLIWPFVLPLCLQYCTSTYVMLVGSIVLMCSKEKTEIPLFLAIGMCTSYFDLLTFPLITFGVPMLLLLAGNKRERWSENLKNLLSHGLAWGMGYAGMWGAKWILATFILKKNVISDAMEQIALRSSSSMGDAEGTESVITVFKSIFSNFCNYSNFIYLLIIVAFLIFVMVYRGKTKGNNSIFHKENIPLFILMIAPIIWYAVFKNHSYVHGAFTYRSMLVFWMTGAYILLKKEK